ncbi:MAG: hypothetical protein CM15mV26_0190 [uncultured marine virus]|nr:MAG: hypothetical protein CM15mV26_0190 [uncultured marine virus]
MPELKDWLNSINQTKKNLIDEDSLLEKNILRTLLIDVSPDILML